MTGAQTLLDLVAQVSWIGFVVLLRIGAVMAALPAFGERNVPARVRLVLSLAFTAIVLPAVSTMVEVAPPSLEALGRYLTTEVVIGLAIGVVIRMFILALQTAGSIAAQSTSLAQLLGNQGVEPLPAIGHLLSIAGLTLLVLTGFHIKAATFLIFSYDLFPMGEPASAAALGQWGVNRVAEAFALAFTLAAPFVILSVLYNLTLGVINKAMPQLMVAFVGAPVITFGSLALLFLIAPLMLRTWSHQFDLFLVNPAGAF